MFVKFIYGIFGLFNLIVYISLQVVKEILTSNDFVTKFLLVDRCDKR